MKITYHKKVIEIDIPKLSKSNKERIKKAIENKLTEHPEIFGKPLQHSLTGARSLRVGDFRVIFNLLKNEVFIILIEHRSVSYIDIYKRL